MLCFFVRSFLYSHSDIFFSKIKSGDDDLGADGGNDLSEASLDPWDVLDRSSNHSIGGVGVPQATAGAGALASSLKLSDVFDTSDSPSLTPSSAESGDSDENQPGAAPMRPGLPPKKKLPSSAGAAGVVTSKAITPGMEAEALPPEDTEGGGPGVRIAHALGLGVLKMAFNWIRTALENADDDPSAGILQGHHGGVGGGDMSSAFHSWSQASLGESSKNFIAQESSRNLAGAFFFQHGAEYVLVFFSFGIPAVQPLNTPSHKEFMPFLFSLLKIPASCAKHGDCGLTKCGVGRGDYFDDHFGSSRSHTGPGRHELYRRRRGHRSSSCFSRSGYIVRDRSVESQSSHFQLGRQPPREQQ